MRKWHPCHIEKAINVTSLYTAFIRQYDKTLNFAGETHNFWEMSCVLEGSVCFACDSNIFTVTAGHAVIFQPLVFHRLWASEGDPPKLATISFDADFNIEVTDCVYEFSQQQAGQMCDIIEGVHSNFKCDGVFVKSQLSPSAQITVCSLESFILSLLQSPSPQEVVRSSTGVRKYAEIVRCLTDNIGAVLTVDDVARICKMSPSSVKQIFKQFTGMGVMQFHRQMKMNSAIAMLLKGLSIKDIAQNLGYTDSNYFSTTFKRVIGVSPTRYLLQMRNNESKSSVSNHKTV